MAKKEEKKVKNVDSSSGYLTNEEDVNAVRDSMESGGGGSKDSIKLDVGKNLIYLLDKGKFKKTYIHYVGGRAFECLGAPNKSYAPDVCPSCAKAAQYFEKKKGSKSKKDKQYYNDLGKQFQSKFTVVMIAVKGFAVKEKVKGESKPITTIGYDDDVKPQFLRLSESQFHQLVGGKRRDGKEIKGLIEEYPEIIKSHKDIVNRALVFDKEEGQYGKVTIIPASRKSDPPEFDAEIPDPQDAIKILDEEEIKDLVKKHLESESDEDDSEDSEEEEESTDELDDDDDSSDDEKDEEKKESEDDEKEDEDSEEEF